jgi:hypothetical protein
MNLIHASTAHKSLAELDDAALYPTQFEFMSVGERLRRINQRIKNFNNKTVANDQEQLERCTMLYFSVDEKRVTEVRHLIISTCKDKLIFMRIKPILHSSMMHVELFLKASAVSRVKDLMRSRFHC